MDPITASLSHSQIFHGVAEGALTALVKISRVVDFGSGDFVVEEQTRVPGLYVLLEGAATLLKGTHEVSVYGRGSFFGEISLFGVSLGATATIKAREKSKFLLVSRENLDQWAKQFPDAERIFLRHMCMELCRRLYSTSERLKT